MLLSISHWVRILLWHTHTHIYWVYCITLLCKNAQLHCHKHHLESLSIASCVEGQKVAYFIKGLEEMGHAQGVVEWHFWTNAYVTDEHELGRHEVNLQSFKYVMYDIDGGNERKKIQLVTSQVSNEFLNSIFSFSYCYFIYVTNYWLVHLYCWYTRYWYATSWRNSLKRHNSM